MKQFQLMIFCILLIGCSSRYVYLESRADIEGWQRKKFGIYSPELHLQFAVNNSTLISSANNVLGVDVNKKINTSDKPLNQLIISMVAEAYVSEVFISAKPILVISKKAIQPESVFFGEHINEFPCKTGKLVGDLDILVPGKSDTRFCMVYVYDIANISYNNSFELQFQRRVGGEYQPVLVKFTPQRRTESVTH